MYGIRYLTTHGSHGFSTHWLLTSPYSVCWASSFSGKWLGFSVTATLWHNHLGEAFVARINLSDSRWSRNIINTRKYNTIYWSSSRNYYNLSLHINYTEEVWSQNYASGYKSEFAEAISSNSQNILFALKENATHQHSKAEDPSTESNPHRFGLPTDNPHRHCWQEEAIPHLHTENNNSKV
jgi:hypothetical protein